jgi:4-hydroxy-tetrahydrodipicolinate synthase
MPRFPDFRPEGVIPAVLLPFSEDFAIDEEAYRAHLRDVTAVDGLAAITTNCHSTEVHACTFEEQKRVLAITMDEVGDRIPVVAGVYADGSLEAARIARMAEAGGASALLVFPPWTLAMGGHLRPEMAITHFKTIADATDLPIICFQYPPSRLVYYPMETLLRLFDQVHSIKAIKDSCGDPQLHERHIRMFQELERPVNVLSTHSAWLMASLLLGCRGLLSGSGSVIAGLQTQLFRAVQAGDLNRAKRINDRIFPTAQAFYAPPLADMHNRMKEALVMLGRLPNAIVRPPLVKLPAAEIKRLRTALESAQLFEPMWDRPAAE